MIIESLPVISLDNVSALYVISLRQEVQRTLTAPEVDCVLFTGLKEDSCTLRLRLKLDRKKPGIDEDDDNRNKHSAEPNRKIQNFDPRIQQGFRFGSEPES